MGGPPLIRPRQEQDIDPLVEALKSLLRTDGYPSRWPPDPAAFVRTTALYGAWVAELNDRIVGHVTLRRPRNQKPVQVWCELSGADPEACAIVSRLFVVAAARGHGLGEALLEAAWADALERGLHPVLDVVDTGQAAIRLYRRLGWVHCGTYEERFYQDGPLELLHCFAAPSGQVRLGAAGQADPAVG
jgi:GNAT superfamily N-acetyltransferase